MERPSHQLKLVRPDFFVAKQEASLRLITKAQVIEGICHYVLDRWHQLTPENQVALGWTLPLPNQLTSKRFSP